ncbi:iron-containing alcohol dehydrogenase [Vibrio tapetis subsp. quintayensis]|uniref:iron-containing alcohol dehydrogenase n=1 Tax=Vibrio tapetis TaxID=52443 RepID=UPI0025B59A69|nr:iron-containing alcohol dehydrogenase [Vibrio tapetis]MDN3681815.1 iron-containing alcohol dehydrogenase [Vibrio tapetis subsp. quintayensis]
MKFSHRIKVYQAYMKALKLAAVVIPMPKPILFLGSDSSLELCQAMAHVGKRKVLIVTDSMLAELGLLDDIVQTLNQYGVETVIFDGVLPDPTYDQVEKGLSIYQTHGCDGVLAVGGGSPIDAGKVIAARVTNSKSIRRLAGLFRVWRTPASLFVIPTTAGTGSEVTIAAVVSDPLSHQKTPIIDPKLVPMMAALDAKLMLGLPAHVTAATGMDALTHAIEAYISRNASQETNCYAMAAIKLIMQNLEKAVEEGCNLQARQNMALASYYAGLAFTKASLGYVHAISHNVGAQYGTPHGLANAIVLPYVLDHSKGAVADKLAEIAVMSGLEVSGAAEIKADRLIEHIRGMLDRMGIPQNLTDIQQSDVPNLAKAALKEAHWNYPVPLYMDQDECERLINKVAGN